MSPDRLFCIIVRMEPIPVFDGHNDTLLNLLLRKRGGGRSFFERSDVGHVDLPRALEGGFGGGFFACFAPPNPRAGWTEEAALTVTADGYEVTGSPPLDPEYASGFADAMTELLFRLEEESGGSLKVVGRRPRSTAACATASWRPSSTSRARRTSVPTPVRSRRSTRRGLRSLGLVWSRPNAYAHGVPFQFPGLPRHGPGPDRGGAGARARVQPARAS